jgi:GDPmannose 4,6-dehydratase
MQEKVYLGNLDAKRDWGHAKDYVEGMWLMLQQEKARDLVLATGTTTSVRDFADMAFAAADIDVAWEGDGVDEIGYDAETGECIVEIDPRYYRPTEVDLLLGDASKARAVLGWEPRYGLAEMAEEMVREDLEEAKAKVSEHSV